jgi:hypothetical protein
MVVWGIDPASPLRLVLMAIAIHVPGAGTASPAPVGAAPVIVPARATWALVTPRLSDLSRDAGAWLDAAGAHSSLFSRPNVTRLWPGLPDLLDPAAVSAAGFDPAAPAAIFEVYGATFLSLGIRPGPTRRTLDQWLSTHGAVRKPVRGGFKAALHEGDIAAAYRIAGSRATLYIGGRRGGIAGKLAQVGGGKGAALSGKGHRLVVRGPGMELLGQVVLSAKGVGLQGQLSGLPWNGAVAVADPAAPGMGWAVVRLPLFEPEPHPAARHLARRLITFLCPGCDGGALATRALGSLNGAFALRLLEIEARPLRGPRPERALLSATRLAALFQVDGGGPAAALLGELARPVGRQVGQGRLPLGEHAALTAPGGLLQLEVGEASAPPWGEPRLEPAVEASLDPRRVAALLERFGLGDLALGGLPAALAYARVEVGGLLARSGPITVQGKLVGSGQLDLSANWPLDGATPSP